MTWVVWLLVVAAVAFLFFIVFRGGGPPSGDPHDSGIGGSI